MRHGRLCCSEAEAVSKRQCDEGTLRLIPDEEILKLSLWEGDRLFLEEILKGNKEPFCFELVYDEKDELISALKLEVEEE